MPDQNAGGPGDLFGDGGAIRPGGLDCEEAVRALYLYLDGELTEERRDKISMHLDRCGPCGSAAEFEAELRVVIASRCKDRVPQGLVDRIAEAIHREELGRTPEAPGS